MNLDDMTTRQPEDISVQRPTWGICGHPYCGMDLWTPIFWKNDSPKKWIALFSPLYPLEQVGDDSFMVFFPRMKFMTPMGFYPIPIPYEVQS